MRCCTIQASSNSVRTLVIPLEGLKLSIRTHVCPACGVRTLVIPLEGLKPPLCQRSPRRDRSVRTLVIPLEGLKRRELYNAALQERRSERSLSRLRD